MNRRVLYTCICLLGVLLTAALPVIASQTIIESPPNLKIYVANVSSDDEHFFAQVTEFMAQLSDQDLNVSEDLWFFALLASGYNIEDHNTAQQLINFLFYSARAGEHYKQYLMNKDHFFTPISAEDEYLLAKEYQSLAEKTFDSCEVCQEYYPDFVMYTLPEKVDEVSDSQYIFTGKLGF